MEAQKDMFDAEDSRLRPAAHPAPANTGAADASAADASATDTGGATTRNTAAKAPPAATRNSAAQNAGARTRPADARGRPSREQVLAAHGTTVPNLVAPETVVLLCGINPSLESGATGFHFANPSNRLWPVLHQAGFTPRRLHPSETDELTSRGISITSLVMRATARADEIDDDEIRAGVGPLTDLVERISPRWVAFLGLAAYRIGFRRRTARVGHQPETLGPAGIWLLPNPSGLNAHYQLPDLVRVYGELHAAVSAPRARPVTGSASTLRQSHEGTVTLL
ncbi:G/U mismatch-specific DNA glycosylase [Frankia sp. AiPa1]|uniref:G/U mismatch-specific DNA glycosylase n=1 Tax=Frankia sp. AiPa1 TaxID=573492 RepID=UPI00202AE4A5|nr:G/U mismatch-specific DNA glycosylase [Frankia sp. AiPa1]MCL9757826.1 G/U mismatch-specific DNA glycosylase [Frankia sp. AiPa1]